jgi:hypothetical protein
MERTRIQDQAVFCHYHEGSRLSALDRCDLIECEDYARTLGYQGLTIHVADPSRLSGIAEYACTCRLGETWVTWVFARFENLVVAWSALTGRDAGTFDSMSEAIRCVLLRDPTKANGR